MLCCFFAFAFNAFARTNSAEQIFADSINQKIRIKLNELANSGYPFATISPVFSQEEGKTRIDFNTEKGIFVNDLRPRFAIESNLREYLVQRPFRHFFANEGEIFNYGKIRVAIAALQTKRYLQSVIFFAPEINGDFFELPVKVRSRNSVFFSGGLGISTHPRISAVGNANLNIVNPLGFGETLDFSYIGEENFYRIGGNLQIPYFANTPLGLHFAANAEIGREDYGSVWLSAGVNFFRGLWTAGISGVYGELSTQDSSSRYSGIKLTLENTRPQLQKGLKTSLFSFEAESGIIHFQRLRMPKAEILANAEFHIPVGVSRFAYLTRPRLGTVAFSTPESLHETQVFRLGGANSLRGYQESVFSAIAFLSSANELRFYIDGFSAVYLLADYAAILEREYSPSQARQFLGYGAGVSLPLRNIIFSLEWARHIRDFSNFGRLHFRFSTF